MVAYIFLMITVSQSQRGNIEIVRDGNGLPPPRFVVAHEDAFAYPGDFLENQFV
jgi:hypothetical protein